MGIKDRACPIWGGTERAAFAKALIAVDTAALPQNTRRLPNLCKHDLSAICVLAELL